MAIGKKPQVISPIRIHRFLSFHFSMLADFVSADAFRLGLSTVKTPVNRSAMAGLKRV